MLTEVEGTADEEESGEGRGEEGEVVDCAWLVKHKTLVQSTRKRSVKKRLEVILKKRET